MLSVNEARTKIISQLQTVSTVTASITDAHKAVLAKPIFATQPSPLFSNSSMDGFAVLAKDVSGASTQNPVRLKIVGDIPAGTFPSSKLDSGNTMRIMTGAPIPTGADAVVPVEDTDFNYRDINAALPSEIAILSNVKAGDYIRNQGEDFNEGMTLIDTGSRLRAQDIALAAMMGSPKLEIYKQPLIALLSSGGELIGINEPLSPGKIRDTNTYSLTALINSAGGKVLPLGIAKDTKEDIKKRLDQVVSEKADMIISSAGVSVGSYDFVRSVVEENGSLDFWKVNMRPGKPLAFGSYKGVPFIGLPGNPVSSFVGFEVFLRPAIKHMSGERNWNRLSFQAKLIEEIHSDGRESYLRVILDNANGEWTAGLTGHQGSGNLHSLSLSNGLAIVPSGITYLKYGSEVEVWPLLEN